MHLVGGQSPKRPLPSAIAFLYKGGSHCRLLWMEVLVLFLLNLSVSLIWMIT